MISNTISLTKQHLLNQWSETGVGLPVWLANERWGSVLKKPVWIKLLFLQFCFVMPVAHELYEVSLVRIQILRYLSTKFYAWTFTYGLLRNTNNPCNLWFCVMICWVHFTSIKTFLALHTGCCVQWILDEFFEVTLLECFEYWPMSAAERMRWTVLFCSSRLTTETTSECIIYWTINKKPFFSLEKCYVIKANISVFVLNFPFFYLKV